jgi:hypothetical protein
LFYKKIQKKLGGKAEVEAASERAKRGMGDEMRWAVHLSLYLTVENENWDRKMPYAGKGWF